MTEHYGGVFHTHASNYKVVSVRVGPKKGCPEVISRLFSVYPYKSWHSVHHQVNVTDGKRAQQTVN